MSEMKDFIPNKFVPFKSKIAMADFIKAGYSRNLVSPDNEMLFLQYGTPSDGLYREIEIYWSKATDETPMTIRLCISDDGSADYCRWYIYLYGGWIDYIGAEDGEGWYEYDSDNDIYSSTTVTPPPIAFLKPSDNVSVLDIDSHYKMISLLDEFVLAQSIMKDTYLTDLFIKEAKPALKRHSGSGGGGTSGAVIKPLTITESGVYDTTLGQFKSNTLLTLKDEGIDVGGMIEAAGGASVVADAGNLYLIEAPTFYISLLYDSGLIFLHLYRRDTSTYYLYVDESMRMAASAMGVTIPAEAKGWGNYTKLLNTGVAEVITGLQIETPTEEYYENHRHIASLEQTAKWLFVEDAFDNKFDGANPITVSVPRSAYEFLSLRDGQYLFAGVDKDTLDNITSKFTIPDYFTSTSFMFYNCTSLTTVPEFDTSNALSMGNMFNGCTSLTTVPEFDTSKVIDMIYMFHNCTSLTTVPEFDTSKVYYIHSMFYNCTSLTTVPEFDTSNALSMGNMFNGCTSLTTVPEFDTSNVDTMYSMFYNCTSLTTVPEFDTSKVDSMLNMFYNCTSLTEVWLKNIKVNLQVGSGTSWGHLITVESLIHLIYELRDTGSSKTLTVGSANLEKLANVYVKTVEITDEMRAEDDLVDEKLPFEVCESTDEGATLITDYAKFKNWQIA